MPQTLNEFLDECEIEFDGGECACSELRKAAKIIREMNNTLLYFRDVGEEDLCLKKGELLIHSGNRVLKILNENSDE